MSLSIRLRTAKRSDCARDQRMRIREHFCNKNPIRILRFESPLLGNRRASGLAASCRDVSLSDDKVLDAR